MSHSCQDISAGYMIITQYTSTTVVLGSCDRASRAKYEERKTNKMQQLDVYY